MNRILIKREPIKNGNHLIAFFLDAPANYGEVAFYSSEDGAHGECDFEYASYHCYAGHAVNASKEASTFYKTIPEVITASDAPKKDKPKRVYRASWEALRTFWNKK